MKRLLSILFFLILPILAAMGRDLPYAYIPLSVEDGLSQPNVTALLSDCRGSLWMPSSSDPEFRRRLDAVILENLSNPDLDVRFLTEKMLMSRTVLYDKVKQETGMGIKDYINRTRIERSVELLLHTDMNISEIAYEVGFSYPRYFSTSFKNMKGVTPTRFKQENRPTGNPS